MGTGTLCVPVASVRVFSVKATAWAALQRSRTRTPVVSNAVVCIRGCCLASGFLVRFFLRLSCEKQKSMVRPLPRSFRPASIGNRLRGIGAIAGVVIVLAALTPGARAQSQKIGNYSGAFGDYYVGVLYRAGKYAQATALARGLLDDNAAAKTMACAAFVRQADFVTRIAERRGLVATPKAVGSQARVALAVQVKAMRRWVRGEQPVVGFLPMAARVMGWTSTQLDEAVPVSIVASGPGDARIAVLESVMPPDVISSSDYRPVEPSVAPVAAAVVTPPEKVKAAVFGRPLALGAGADVKKARGSAAKGSAPVTGGGKLDDWMERAFTN